MNSPNVSVVIWLKSKDMKGIYSMYIDVCVRG